LLCRDLDQYRRRRAQLVAELERQNAEHEARTNRLKAELAEVDQRIAALEAELAAGVAAD
jgi:flagellar motility protein MotE (MotC chaperone)